MKLKHLIARLQAAEAAGHGESRVELMIEFDGKGQWQAVVTDSAVCAPTDPARDGYVVIIHEDTP